MSISSFDFPVAVIEYDKNALEISGRSFHFKKIAFDQDKIQMMILKCRKKSLRQEAFLIFNKGSILPVTYASPGLLLIQLQRNRTL
jgi:hypothetical protein